MRIEVIGIEKFPEIKSGDKLSNIIIKTCKKNSIQLRNNDIIVISQKIISKSENQIINISTIKPTSYAKKIALRIKKDPRVIEVILSESEEVIRISDSVIITKTKHGFICANSGVDNSNISEGLILLLPKDPDKSALEIRNEIKKELTIDIAVIITDSFGRPWRNGQVDIAIGTSGIEMIKDYRGLEDKYGNRLQATEIAIIDELAAAAELVKGKTDQIPIAIIRNYMYRKNDKPIKQIIRDKNIDLFL